MSAPGEVPAWLKWTGWTLSLPFRGITWLLGWIWTPISLIWGELKGLRTEEAQSFAIFILCYAGGYSIARITYVNDPWGDAYFLIAFTTVIVMGFLVLGIRWFKLKVAQMQIAAGQGVSAEQLGLKDQRIKIETPAPSPTPTATPARVTPDVPEGEG